MELAEETRIEEVSENPFSEKFEGFFKTPMYKKQIEKLVASYPQKRSINIDYTDLEHFDFQLADELLEHPDYVLQGAKNAIKNIDIPALEIESFEPHIRIVNLPVDKMPLIRDISAEHLNKLVAVEGVVRQFNEVQPKLRIALWQCRRCNNTYKIIQEGFQMRSPAICECRHKDFKLVEEQSIFENHQKIGIQEPLEKLKGGEQANTLDVHVTDDLVNKVSPGDKTIIVGILRLYPAKEKKIVFGRYLEAVSLEEKEKEFSEVEISKEEVAKIKKVSKKKEIFELLVKSIAPSIYGHELVKEAITLQLFSGVKKTLPGEMKVRGNIHILLVGEAGLAKSQLLKAVDNIAPKSIYVAGKTTSGVGLCVAPETLVLNDNGFRDIKGFVEEKFQQHKAEEELPNAFSNKFEGNAFSLNENMEVEEAKIYKIWKIKSPEKVVGIKTRLGKEITITPQTPLVSFRFGMPIWTKAKDLKKGDFVACARVLPEGKKEKIPTISVLENCENIIVTNNLAPKFKEITDKLAKKYGSLQEIAKRLGKSRANLYAKRNAKTWQGIPLKEFLWLGRGAGYSENELSALVKEIFISYGKNIQIPQYLDNEEIAYLAGLALGDGSVYKNEKENSVQTRIFSASPQILEKVDEIVKKYFGIKPEAFDDGKRVPGRRIKYKAFFEILKAFGLKEKKQEISISHLATEMKNKVLSGLLRGLFDTDGYVSKPTKHRESPHIGIGTISKNLAQKIQLCLTKYGISSKLRLRKKAGKTAKGKNITVTSRFDQYYIEIRGKENLERFQKNIGFYLEEKKQKLNEVISNISKTGHSNIEKIKGDKDIVWEEITEICEKKPEFEYVYDFSVEKNHNFIGNGFIVHNTASAERDEFGEGGWTLKAGALVLASGGIGLIDEFDKMDPEDRSAMHEALEQGSVSIAKAGIVTTFRTDTSVLAAANPKYGRFDPYTSPLEQIDLPATLLSRFDLFFMIKDVLDRKKDTEIATFILQKHQEGEKSLHERAEGKKEEEKETKLLDIDLMKKYISYARQKVFPVMTDNAMKNILEFYLDMREQGRKEGHYTVTHRQLEALVRLSEASARIKLKDLVEEDDTERAIRIFKSSLQEVAIDTETGSIDIDIIASGAPHSKVTQIKKILSIIREKTEEGKKTVSIDEVVEEALSEGIERDRTEELIKELKRKGDLYEPSFGKIKPTERKE